MSKFVSYALDMQQSVATVSSMCSSFPHLTSGELLTVDQRDPATQTD